MNDIIKELLEKAKDCQNKKENLKAEKFYKKIIDIDINNFEAHNLLGILCCQYEKFNEGLKYFNKAINIQDNHAGLYCNKGNAHFELNEFEEAVKNYDIAISLHPKLVDAYYNKGNALQKLQSFEESIISYDKALEFNSNLFGAYINKGNSLKNLKKLDEAITNYNKAIEINSNEVEPNWNKAITLLLKGDLEEGWKYYEWRWKKYNFSSEKRNFSQPLWLGDFNINKKIILIHTEQGLGDSIQFSRYIELVEKLGAKVIFEVEDSLIKLMKNLNGNFAIVRKGEKLPFFDCHCPLLSLPHAFKTNINSIPQNIPYITKPSLPKKIWENKLNQDNFNIGICWQGSSYSKDEGRSFSIKYFKNISKIKNVKLFSLQKNDGAEQLHSNFEEIKVINFGSDLDKEAAFLDTAVLMTKLDLIITVDTSIAHLAGSMGCKVWVLLQFIPDWRWMLDKKITPWYPSMKLFRQSKLNDWNGPFKQIENEINSFINSN